LFKNGELNCSAARENGAADALSRRGKEVELKLILVTTVELPAQLLQDLKKDSELEALRLSLETNAKGMEGYSSVDGEIRYRGCLVLPRTSEWIPRILCRVSWGTIGGTLRKNKYSNRSPAGLLQPLELPFRVWEDLTMDFVEGLPKSASYSVIMVVVDRLITSVDSGIGRTPFKVLYGRDPPRLVSYDRGTTVTAEVDQYLWERDRVLAELRAQYHRAQQVMKSQADGKRRDVEFAVGDLVYLKLRPYRQVSVAKRVNQKLSPLYYGPFAVVERIGQVAYRLKLPLTSSIHPVFHVSQLKRVIGDHQVVCDLPYDLVTESPLVPAEVCGSRLNGGHHEVLIAWKDMPESEATWEGFEEMQRQFPDFHLEDKVSFWDGSDDADLNRWGKVYRRKTTTQGG
ncbi:ribonuclease H-like domain containing protein, partial [Tanacetum coccineum]